MTSASTVSTTPYTRDRFTWLAYFMLACFAYAQAALSPAMPFLKAELGLSFSAAGLHFSVSAVGMIIAGLTGDALARRRGRGFLFWGGGGGMMAGALLLALGRREWITIPAAFVMGWWGTYLLIMIPATLSDWHGSRRATALTESNVFASAATTLPPLFVGFFASVGIGWRATFILVGLVWLAGTLLNHHVRLPEPAHDSNPGAAARARSVLPRTFWVYWVIIVLVVAAEWSIAAWSAAFLAGVVGLERSLAATLMSAFFLAMVIGRFFGSRLTYRADSAALLPAALGLALTGFLIFWLAPLPVLNVIGLFLAGLGIANLYPLSLAVTTTLAAAQPDRASARVSLAAGVAILIAPQVLGTTADAIGLALAMGLVVALLLAAAAMLAAARRLSGRAGEQIAG